MTQAYGSQSGMNDRNKTHCIAGHEFTPENTRIKDRKHRKTGEVTGRMRVCITCGKTRSAEHRARQKIIEIARELGMLKE